MTDELQFLELSLPAPDVRDSLEWYRSLGFIELSTTDVRDYPYAVVTDGHFCIGLHGSVLAAPGLTFVRPDLEKHVRSLQLEDDHFEHISLGTDEFHEAIQADPNGSLAIMLEARTFSPSHNSDTTPLTGMLDSLTLPCLHIAKSLEFWQRYGFMAVESEDSDHAELHRPGLAIELQAGTHNIMLCFQPHDYDAAVAALNRTHELKMFKHNGLKAVELTAPEGTRLLVLTSQADSN